jgi:hypothetical protein
MRLTPGDVRNWRVCEQAVFGVVVESVDDPAIVGVIDIIFLTNDKTQSVEAGFPVRSVIEAVVQGYAGDQLRLSALPEDLSRARG